MSFTPTGQQIEIVDAVKGGGNVVVEALAGTGKTSTLKLCAHAAPKSDKILYIAFNKSIADEAAKSFPQRVSCKTVHSVAYGPVGSRYSHRIRGARRVTARMAASILGVTSYYEFEVMGHKTTLGSDKIARLAMDTVTRYCQSASLEIEPWHVPTVNGLEDQRDEVRAIVLPFARKAWADIQKLDGMLKFTHDHYLKMFALSDPKLPFDAIYFDEAQDSNPVKSGLVLAQTHAQRIAVGDRNQAIYGWTGAKDAMQDWPADQRLALTKSFRFGNAVAEEANKWLTVLKAKHRVEGYEEIPSELLQIHDNVDDLAVLCRTNAQCVATAADGIEDGRKVYIQGGTNEIRWFAEEAMKLMQTGNSSHPDLAAFASWDDVKTYVEQDGGGADLKVFVNLMDNYGAARIMEIADACLPKERAHEAQLVVSTAHKAKGQEFKLVKIAPDFKEPVPDPETGEMKDNTAEFMLAYVSVTRAQLVLDNGGLAWVDNLLPAEPIAA